jgi:hypothetical protein
VSDTASIRIYHIREGFDLTIADPFVHELKYEELQFDNNIQQVNNVEIRAFVRANKNRPEWAGMLWQYINKHEVINDVLKLDFIGLIRCNSTSNKDVIFAFCGGGGYFDIEEKIDKSFGIAMLETVFDPNSNRIKSVSDKGIMGDILASRRFYRFARPIFYEDNFGKYYQGIEVRLSKFQLARHFPLFSQRKGSKLKPNVTISGSATLDVKVKLGIIDFICLIKDLANLVEIESPHIFNRSLIPLATRSDRELIAQLDEKLFDNLARYCLDPGTCAIDFDFCHRDFEQFFGSSSCHISLGSLTTKKGVQIEAIKIDDVYDLSDAFLIGQLTERIKRSREFEEAPDRREFVKDVFKSAKVVTTDDEGMETTRGRFKEYLQQEFAHEGSVYFLLDDRWYYLRNEFESNLDEKYARNIKTKFQRFDFILPWNGPDEEAYNRQYLNQRDSFFLHRIKIDHIELVDVLIVDIPKKTIYFLHVKDKVGAAMRDLTSQVHMAARIIEEEVAAGKDKLRRLYEQAVANARIVPANVSEDTFLGWIEKYQRVYMLGIHDSRKSEKDILAGNFNSRIAKYSLIGFANEMRTANWGFSLCVINDPEV